MSKIKGKNSKPELLVRKFLFSKWFRYRLHESKLPWSPDIVLKKYNTVIFINWCFWHWHENCKYYTIPHTNTEFRSNKIETNINRDIRNYKDIKVLWYKVIVVWECELKGKQIPLTLNNIIAEIIS